MAAVHPPLPGPALRLGRGRSIPADRAALATPAPVKGPPNQANNTNETGALAHANSACAASGLNDFDSEEGQTVSQVQTAADSWKYYGLPKGAVGLLPDPWRRRHRLADASASRTTRGGAGTESIGLSGGRHPRQGAQSHRDVRYARSNARGRGRTSL
jgi:hypothetical protein